MKHTQIGSTYLDIILIIALATGFVLAVKTMHPHTQNDTIVNVTASNGHEARFTGTVTKNCDHVVPDVGCTLELNHYVRVAIHQGNINDRTPWGTATGPFKIGQKVSVYGLKEGDNDYTIRGSSSYYVKPID